MDREKVMEPEQEEEEFDFDFAELLDDEEKQEILSEEDADAEAKALQKTQPRMNGERNFRQETDELLKKFPEICGRSLPEQVVLAAMEGKSLLRAYEDYKTEQVREENARLQKELAVLRQNRTAAKRAPVKAASGGESVRNRAEDDFLRGFNEDE